jgi:hypothetical protein
MTGAANRDTVSASPSPMTQAPIKSIFGRKWDQGQAI